MDRRLLFDGLDDEALDQLTRPLDSAQARAACAVAGTLHRVHRRSGWHPQNHRARTGLFVQLHAEGRVAFVFTVSHCGDVWPSFETGGAGGRPRQTTD